MKIAIAQTDMANSTQLLNDASKDGFNMILFPELVFPNHMLPNIIIGAGYERRIFWKKYNAYGLFYNRSKPIFEYRKQNLFPGYDDGRTPGKRNKHHDRVYFAICYDIRNDKLFEKMKNPRMIVIPADFPLERINDWRNLLIKRAVDKKCCVIGINTPQGGSTMVAMPDGTIYSEIPAGEVGMICAEFDTYSNWEEYLHDRDY